MNKAKRVLIVFSLFILSAAMMVGFQNFSRHEIEATGCVLAKKTYRLNAEIVDKKWRTLALTCPGNSKIQDLYHSYFHTVVTQWNATTNSEKDHKPCTAKLNIVPDPEQVLSDHTGC